MHMCTKQVHCTVTLLVAQVGWWTCTETTCENYHTLWNILINKSAV